MQAFLFKLYWLGSCRDSINLSQEFRINTILPSLCLGSLREDSSMGISLGNIISNFFSRIVHNFYCPQWEYHVIKFITFFAIHVVRFSISIMEKIIQHLYKIWHWETDYSSIVKYVTKLIIRGSLGNPAYILPRKHFINWKVNLDQWIKISFINIFSSSNLQK
jgi:hypothetical protein